MLVMRKTQRENGRKSEEREKERKIKETGKQNARINTSQIPEIILITFLY